MGGDYGVTVTIPAALAALQRFGDLHLYLVGDQHVMEPLLQSGPGPSLQSRFTIVHTPSSISDNDKPSRVLRDKIDSSMYLAVSLVKERKAQACVSAGNTGALLMIGRHLLKTIDGIDKPAMITTLPGASASCLLLDVGANVDCKAEQLFQFAVMGSVLAETQGGIGRARVGLLNIGSEEFKGSEPVRGAAAMLEQCDAIEYIGYIEGSALYSGQADIVVCDGFTGNVTIKSSAGVAKVIAQILNDTIASGWVNRFLAWVSMPLLRQMRQRINPSQFNGASLLGLQGSIVKSHGNASVEGFGYAIEQAIREADNRIPQMIAHRVASILQQDQAIGNLQQRT